MCPIVASHRVARERNKKVRCMFATRCWALNTGWWNVVGKLTDWTNSNMEHNKRSMPYVVWVMHCCWYACMLSFETALGVGCPRWNYAWHCWSIRVCLHAYQARTLFVVPWLPNTPWLDLQLNTCSHPHCICMYTHDLHGPRPSIHIIMPCVPWVTDCRVSAPMYTCCAVVALVCTSVALAITIASLCELLHWFVTLGGPTVESTT